MANRKKADRSSQSVSKNRRQLISDRMFSSSSSDECDQLFARRNRTIPQDHLSRNSIVENNQQTGQDVSRREENPFSFKHFLKGESQTNYYKTGARPKIYSSSSTTSPNNVEKDTGVYSRNPTELPDFVQDHLVIEQCYLNHVFNQQDIPEVENLPDFALNSVEQRQSRHRNDSKKSQPQLLPDIPFDLTGSLDQPISQKDFPPNAVCLNSINIPVFNAVDNLIETSGSASALEEPEISNNVVTRDCTPTTDSNVPKLLPDFLNDGPIHSRTNLSNDIGSNLQSNMVESTERRLLAENDRLRQELDSAHRKINEKSDRIQMLEAEVAARKEADCEDTADLERAMEIVECNLKSCMERALCAESTVTLLRKEIKTLKTELLLLRLENKELRSAAVDKNEYGASSGNVDRTVRRLASELRAAASTAEVSLRQLMSGVENLRVLASTIENVDRIEDTTKDFIADSDENNAAGPAI